MNLFQRKTKSSTPANADRQAQPALAADISYRRLEPRQVLSASFAIGVGGLFLDGFDIGQDLSFSQETVLLDGALHEAYVFDVASGSWSGSTADPMVELESVFGGTNNRLQVGTALLGGPANANLNINGAVSSGVNVGFTQTTSLAFDSLAISNFTNFDRSLILNTTGDLSGSNLSVADSNPTDAINPDVDLQLKTQGEISITGPLQNQVANPDADILLIAAGTNNDVTISNAIETTLGDISISADDSVLFSASGTLTSGGLGNVDVETGLDGVTGDDGDQIRMASGSLVDAGNGQVSLNTNLGGDVLLGTVSSLNAGDAITIDASGNIIDNLATENSNLVAANGRVNLVSGNDIGSIGTGDIDIQSQLLRFDSAGEAFLTDGAFGLTIDRSSSALGGGEIRSSHFLTIGANVDVGSSTIFSAGNSPTVDDDLTINNGAVVQLNSTVGSTIEFVAGDDIVIDGGRIVTSGVPGTHTVKITADNEGAADSDRGSITNSAGINPVIETNTLELTAYDGIGDASLGPNVEEPLRINADRLVASNIGQNDVLINELDSIELVDVNNADGAVSIAAASQIDVTSVTTGETETVEDSADDISIVSTNGSIAITNIDSADDLLLQANNGSITDYAGGQIDVAGDAMFIAGTEIKLTDTASDLLQIQGNANFAGPQVSIGQDGFAAGDTAAANTFLGGLTVTADTAVVVEDDATALAGTSTVMDLSIASGGAMTNAAGISPVIVSTNLELSAIGGIGDASSGTDINQPLRIDAARLVASNIGQNNVLINELNSIELVDVRNADGAVSVTAVGQINVTSVTTGESEIAEDGTDDISIVSTNGSIAVNSIDSADDLLLQADNGNITDDTGGQIRVAGDAIFIAGTEIKLTDTAGDLLQIQGNANFAGPQVSIGQDGFAAGDTAAANTFLGGLTVTADTAVVVEDDATALAGTSTVTDFSIASGGSITSLANTEITVTGHTQLNTADGIFVGAQPNDLFVLNTIGVVAANVHLELDSSIELNGNSPSQTPSEFGLLPSRGTVVDQTLFVTSTGSIVQSTGQLNAASIGLMADEHVHLARIAASNTAVAIKAGTAAPLTDATTIQNISALANAVNSEVNAEFPQSIALIHESALNVTTVNSPFDGQSLAGLTTTGGSIFADAKNDISIQQDIVAQSTTDDPQVTLYSETGTAEESGIIFDGGQVEVLGPTNAGIVNKLQTSAIFFDENGFVLEGTTEILVLNTDGSADQDIVVQYADPGETGYRVIIVWDKDNQPGQPVEIINTFVSDPNLDTEGHEDEILDGNVSIVRAIGANEGGIETFSKFPRYSKEAIIAHQDNPNVFSTVTIRSDQDINFFSGPLDALTNSLNEVTQTLRAELDSPKLSLPADPRPNPINPIEIKTSIDVPDSSAAPDESSSLTFSRDVQPFESGDLKWVLVAVPMDDLEESDGEIRLKDPTRVFPKADDAEVNDIDDQIGENEVDKIIQEIETDSEAESGYWYKIFKDYRNRDDELFFYHFKSGQPQPDNTAPQSDFENSIESAPADGPETEPNNEPTDTSGGTTPYSDPAALDPETAGANQIPDLSPPGLSAGSLLMAGMMIRRSQSSPDSRVESGNNHSQLDRPAKKPSAKLEPNNVAVPIRFGRLDRLKRKIKNRFTPPAS